MATRNKKEERRGITCSLFFSFWAADKKKTDYVARQGKKERKGLLDRVKDWTEVVEGGRRERGGMLLIFPPYNSL